MFECFKYFENSVPPPPPPPKKKKTICNRSFLSLEIEILNIGYNFYHMSSRQSVFRGF